MDVTPQLLKDVEFRQSLRGYDPDEVDLFLQRVGAGVAQLQGRLAEAISRAEAAESRIDRGDTPSKPRAKAARSGEAPTEETITRTLVLAQQTADKLLREARAEASTAVASAESEADELRATAKAETDELRSTTEAEVSELRTRAEADAAVQRGEAEQILTSAIASAEAERNALLGDVESEARRVAEQTRAPLLDEIRELEGQRNSLRTDVELLESHADEQRGLIRSAIGRLQSVIDNPETLRVAAAPETSEYSLATAEAVHVETEPTYRAPVDRAASADEVAPVVSGESEIVSEQTPVEESADTAEAPEAEAEALEAAEVMADSSPVETLDSDVDADVDGGADAISASAAMAAGATAATVAGGSILDKFGSASTPEVADLDAGLADDLGVVEPVSDAEIDLTDKALDAESDRTDDVDRTDEERSSEDALEETTVDSEPIVPEDDDVSASAEDDVVPSFDNDDFFDGAPIASDGAVIDLTEASRDVGGEPTQAFSVAGDDEPTGDAFMDELRRAVGDDDLVDEDPAMVAFFDDDSDGPTRRFGRGS